MTNLGLPPGHGRARASTVRRDRRSATATCSRRSRPAASSLGGEQSGHVIFRDLATTGDGAAHRRCSSRRRGRGRAAAGRAGRAAMTRLPAGAAQRARSRRGAATSPTRRRRRRRRRRGRARRRRAGARAPERHRAARAGDGRGADRRRRPRPPPTGSVAAVERACGPMTALGTPPGPPSRQVADRRSSDARSVHSCAASSPSSAARPPDRRRPRRRRSALLERGPAGVARRRRPRRRRAAPAADAARGASTRCCAACPACAPCSARPRRSRRASSGRRRGARRDWLATLEAALDAGAARSTGRSSRTSTPPSSALKDAVWAVRSDRLRTARGGRATSPAPTRRGRRHRGVTVDPAGAVGPRPARGARPRLGRPALLVRDHGLDLDDPAVRARCSRERAERPAVRARRRAHARRATSASSTRRRPRSASSATTPRRCARAIAGDDAAAPAPSPATDAEVVVLGHTRWASVGIISEANAHPLNSRGARRRRRARTSPPRSTATSTTTPTSRRPRACASPPRSPPTPRSSRRSCRAALADGRRPRRGVPRHGRRASRGRSPSAPAAADARPTCCSRCGAAARRSTSAWPRTRYVVASEPYGAGRGDAHATSAWTARRRPTPTTRPPAGARSSCSTRRAPARSRASRALAYDGTELPVADDELVTAADHHPRHRPRRLPHFLLKEISEAPASFRKTLRGKLVERDGALVGARSATTTLPADVRARPAPTGRIDRVLVIGQGTAAVAGQSLAAALDRALADGRAARRGRARHRALGVRPARRHDRHARRRHQPVGHHHRHQPHRRPRARPAARAVVAIVNRRNSDLTDKSDGVLYTSDGRDVEMSVASTKAFYAQIAAGFLLAVRRSPTRSARPRRPRRAAAARRRCATCPTRWTRCSTGATDIAEAAQQLAPSRRYWAIVGNGANRIAAEELRIKLSRALLQVDRLRRHRGQEAHRPLVRAADPRVRRRARRARPPTTSPRRWRSTGPTRRRRSSSPPRARSASRAALARHHGAGRRTRRSPSCCRRWPGTCSATRRRSPSTPRPGRCARPGPRSRTAVVEHAVADGDDLLRSARSPSSSRSPPRFFDGLRSRRVRRPPRGEHRGAAGVAAPLRHRHRARSRRTRSSTARSARPASWSRTSPPRSPRASRSSPARSTPSSTRPRRSPSASPAPTRRCCRSPLVAGGARRRRAPATGSATAAAHARRPRPAVAEVLGYTRYRVEGDADDGEATDRRRRPRRHRAATSRRAPSATRCCGAPSTGSPREREVLVAAGPQRRPHA